MNMICCGVASVGKPSVSTITCWPPAVMPACSAAMRLVEPDASSCDTNALTSPTLAGDVSIITGDSFCTPFENSSTLNREPGGRPLRLAMRCSFTFSTFWRSFWTLSSTTLPVRLPKNPPTIPPPTLAPTSVPTFSTIEPDPPCIDPERSRSEENTSELQSRENLVCRLLLEKKKKIGATVSTKNAEALVDYCRHLH